MLLFNEFNESTGEVSVTLGEQQHRKPGNLNVQKKETSLENSCTETTRESIALFGVQYTIKDLKQDLYNSSFNIKF